MIVPSDRPLSEIELVAFDLETTGLCARSCRIVEFGAVRFRLDGTEVACMEQLVDPGCRIPRFVTGIHGITDAMVKGMPGVGAILPRFRDFLGDPDTLLMAHNAAFDIRFLEAAFNRSRAELPVQPVLDTLRLARRCVHGLSNRRLQTLAIHFGLAAREDHRALSDARLAKGLFLAILRERGDLRTIQDLFDLAKPMEFGVATADPLPVAAVTAELTWAIQQQRTVVMVYSGGSSGSASRRITPLSLVRSGGRPYMVAVCHIDGIEKTFRLDRIVELRVDE
ncbi:MAG: WYL domain-containing protein [Rhodopirellula sp.]|nr:WYL domain-containing protein [Rhodopirellula sp.]